MNVTITEDKSPHDPYDDPYHNRYIVYKGKNNPVGVILIYNNKCYFTLTIKKDEWEDSYVEPLTLRDMEIIFEKMKNYE